MTSNTAFSVLLFAASLVAAFAAASAGAEVNVMSICNHASFPKLCRALIPSLSHPITANSLTEASLKKAAAKGEEAKEAATRYMAAPDTTKDVKQALQMCYKSFDAATNRLNEAAKLLKEVGLHDKVMTKIQSALATLGDCDDAFNEFPWVPSPVAHISEHLEKLTSNSLSLAIGAY